MASRISMLATHHSCDDCQDCDDEESSHVCLFPVVVVSYEYIIPSSCRFVNPYGGQFRNFLRLDVAVGSCPSEHSTPSRWSDTLGAGDAVSDVVGEASNGHCVALFLMLLLYYYYRQKSTLTATFSQIFSKFFGLVISPYLATGYV